jgi:hypothetical protein
LTTMSIHKFAPDRAGDDARQFNVSVADLSAK